HLVGIRALDGGSYGTCTSVCSLRPVYVKVIVCEYGAAYGRYADGLFLYAQIPDDFRYEVVDGSVAAPRTIVHHFVRENRRFAEYQVLFLYLYFKFSHIFTYLLFSLTMPRKPGRARTPHRRCDRNALREPDRSLRAVRPLPSGRG